MNPHQSWQRSSLLNWIYQSWSKSWIYPKQSLFPSLMRTGGPPSLINNVKFNPIYCSLLYGSWFCIGGLYDSWVTLSVSFQKKDPHIIITTINMIIVIILALHLLKAGAALPVSFQKRTLDHPHHHPHITPVKMRESLKFSFLPTSSSPPAIVSAIILSNNFANKV